MSMTIPSLEQVQKHAAEWPGIQKLSVVQTILDQNKLLIAEIHRNHEIRSPDSLRRNIALIRELNSNIARVVHAYQEVSLYVGSPAPSAPSAQPTQSMQTS